MAAYEGTDDAPPLTSAEFDALFRRLRDATVWGPNDRRGALNNLTPWHVLAAVGEVRSGHTVSLAAPIETVASQDNPDPCSHEMAGEAGDPAAAPGLHFAMDSLAMNVHGNADSHIDALCHVIFNRTLYNGVDPGTVATGAGTALSIDVARDGIVGRGVLLDIPRVRGVSWLEPGDHVTLADLEAAERALQVRIGTGDVVFVRVGHRRRRDELGAWDAARARAGLHPIALLLLAERGVAALGSDGNNDTAPSITAGVDFPIHVLAINAMGLHLLDYLRFEELAARCAEAGRWSFLCVIAPLRLPSATGSPVNPIAIL
jgi:kynurenine formamidase